MAKKPMLLSTFFTTAFSIGVLIFYILVYQLAPFAEPWNDMALNTAISLAALTAAVIATLIFFSYHPQDAPRAVWRDFAIGSWCWGIAETIWELLAYLNTEVQSPSYADIFWVLGFVFFTTALHRQYNIIHPKNAKQSRQAVLYIWVPSVIFFLYYFINKESVGTYLDYWYSFMDFCAGIGGLLIMLSFQGGAMARPWIGLIVFGISDFLYAWAEQTGLYAWSSEQGNSLTLIIDTSYVAAYLILALGFLAHWLLLKNTLMHQK